MRAIVVAAAATVLLGKYRNPSSPEMKALYGLIWME
jgi:hypothetical protein